MTKEGLAKAYHERIIERNPQAEAWNFSGAFIDGYDAGYDAAMNNRFDCDITPREKAKAYCLPILKDNHNKTYGFELYDIEDGFMAGYAEGFADMKNIYERRNTDKSRDEQIEKASVDFEMGYDPKMCAGEFFRDGAKWADEHPKDKRQLLTDEMIIKIINLYNSFGVDKVDENSKVLSVETIKQHLYER